jgi:hypothetical protein
MALNFLMRDHPVSAPSASQAQPISEPELAVGVRIDEAAYNAANVAFQRELPELLKLRNHKCRWVLYHRDKRIAVAATKTDLYRIVNQRNLPRAEIVCRFITEVQLPDDLLDRPAV